MTKRIVNPYNVSPSDLRPGDVMVRQVVAHVLPGGRYRVYRAPSDGDGAQHEDGVPQGENFTKLLGSDACETLFPCLILLDPD